jgi:hypothetical protein
MSMLTESFRQKMIRENHKSEKNEFQKESYDKEHLQDTCNGLVGIDDNRRDFDV